MKLNKITLFLHLTLFTFIPTSSLFGMMVIEAEHEGPSGEGNALTLEHQQQEKQKAKEIKEEEAQAEQLRLENVTHHSSTSVASQHSTLHHPTSFESDSTLPTTSIITVAGEENQELTGLSSEARAKIQAIGRGEHDFVTTPRPRETSKEKLRRKKGEQIRALIKIFQDELEAREKTWPKDQRLTGEQRAKLKTDLMSNLLTMADDPEQIEIEIKNLLDDAERLNPPAVKEPEEPLEPEAPQLTEEQQLIQDAIARGRENPDYKTLSNFQKQLIEEKKLSPFDAATFTNRLKDLILQDPKTFSSPETRTQAIEAKKAELLKEVDTMNAKKEKDQRQKEEEIAANAKAAQEKEAFEAAEKVRKKQLAKQLIDDFRGKLSKQTSLSLGQMRDLDDQFETVVTENPDNSVAIEAKRKDLLAQADTLSEPYILAQKARDEAIRQANKSTVDATLDDAIARVQKIRPKAADILRKLKARIEAKQENPDTPVKEIFETSDIVKQLLKDLPQDPPSRKNFFGKDTGKWTKAQKQQAQNALDAAEKALNTLFPEETSVTPTQKLTPKATTSVPKKPSSLVADTTSQAKTSSIQDMSTSSIANTKGKGWLESLRKFVRKKISGAPPSTTISGSRVTD